MKHIPKPIFLSARWENLILANYKVDPAVLKPYIPKGTELDFFNHECYISLVGFNFINTKILNLTIPFHKNFEEFNLRFYVKYKTAGEWKRGVVFIKEIVPRPVIAIVANIVYHEPYVFYPMKNKTEISKENIFVEYSWKIKGNWNFIRATAENKEQPITENSIEEFITEHYWGYNQFSSSVTMEYEVEHPSWTTYSISAFEIECDYQKIYPAAFSKYLSQKPASVILAKGSDVLVRKGSKLIF